ncbi:hypothetical protein PMIN06_002399 [Paraphaeosphaeria minitans]|uniref:NADH-ubiquinone oxidoreductase 29.9 kDa subunit, mitochondrial n=1 Tax=Paraphaeosphaeria minitans TaxID=565426 RepID=A0A9P6KQF0_9PLEO|nr:NADH-ubiquinone oxidoreductase 29.9 kDa subunit, mitochondrial [Paraphaeosphaeria minitans]
MRAAARLLAAVRHGKYLEPGAPTGLTGLLTHPSPRSTLLYHYQATLDKLQQIPDSSVYRQSTEALTKHRLKIIEEAVPAGWAQWQETIQDKIHEDPASFKTIQTSQGTLVEPPKYKEFDPRTFEAAWDGEKHVQYPPGMRTQQQRRAHVKALKGDANYTPERTISPIKLPPEPQYTVEAINELETRLGAGLIEEVIQVAEGEHKLVDEMIKAKVWEPLEEQAPEGQWKFFERGQSGHTRT